MKILPKYLSLFAPEITELDATLLAEQLTLLGFETEQDGTDALDVSVTPNRADGTSHLGLARDVRASLAAQSDQEIETVLFNMTGALDSLAATKSPPIYIRDNVAAQYHAVVLDNVTIQPSPAWLQRELILLGLRPINNVVDVTNYLMELYGQPLHAFDADAVKGDMIVRASRAGERLETLDGTVHTLPEGVAVIEDETGLIDLAGIRGGKTSEIRPDTKRVLLQSAIFDRWRIRKAVTALSYRTSASTRFERGVDPAISLSVLGEAVRLLTSEEFGKAQAAAKQIIATDGGKRTPVAARAAAISKLLGLEVPADRQAHLFRLLGCEVTQEGGNLTVTPPTWRFDLNIWQDLAEEVERLTGLDESIPSTPLPPAKRSAKRSDIEWAEALKDRLTSIGLSEVQTYSFISARDMKQFGLESTGELANPLNPELAFLRPSLMPNLASVVARNGIVDPITVFEIGHVFTTAGERINLGIGLASVRIDTKQWISELARALDTTTQQLTPLLTVKELDQVAKSAYKIRKQQVVLIEMALERLHASTAIEPSYRVPTAIQTYRPLSKFPPVARDVALIVDRSVSQSDVIERIVAADPRVESADLFDEFVSDRMGASRKSLAFHIYYADLTRTLTSDEADAIHRTVQQSLVDSFGATIR